MPLLFTPHTFRKLTQEFQLDVDGTSLQPDFVETEEDIPCHVTRPGLKVGDDMWGIPDPNLRVVKIDLQHYTSLGLKEEDKIQITTEEFANKQFVVKVAPFPRTEFAELDFAQFAAMPV